jgi:hypothetical protein
MDKSVAAYLGKLIAKLRNKIAVRTDERMRLMTEIVSGIQVIKMYAWEKPFAKLVEVARLYVICNEKLDIQRSVFVIHSYIISISYISKGKFGQELATPNCLIA